MVQPTRPRALRQEDAPLNRSDDQGSNLNPQLRRLNMKLGLGAVLDLVSDPPAALLLAAAVGALFKRKYLLACCLATGCAVRQALAGPAAPPGPLHLSPAQRKEMEFERYAIKAQRGDYGNLQVIAFR